MNSIRYLFLALIVIFACFATAEAQPCPPGQGCNDLNAISATATLPQVNVQPPPTVTLPPVQQIVRQPVNVVVEPYVTNVTVMPTRGPVCVNWQNVSCSCVISPAPDMRACAIYKGRPDLGFFPGLFSQKGCEEERLRRR